MDLRYLGGAPGGSIMAFQSSWPLAAPDSMSLPISCGTLIVNSARQLLLCHVTGTARWDIPKGMMDDGETPLQAAQRELLEEAGLVLDGAGWQDLGEFDYRPDKRLHLFRVEVGDTLGDLQQLNCTSMFVHEVSGVLTPECDGYRWASRRQIPSLCWTRMGQRLMALEW